MHADIQSLDPTTKRVDFTYSAAEVSQRISKEFKDLSKKVKVPGFRPGKIPLKVLQRRYGANVKATVQQELVEEAWRYMMTELKARPLTQPDLNLSSKLLTTKDFEFSFQYSATEDFELVDPSSFEIGRTQWKMSDARLNEELENLRKQHGTWNLLEARKEAQFGDQVTFSLKALKDDVALDILSADEERVELGSKRLIPELEAAMDKRQTDEEFSLDYSFPEDHPNPELKGISVRFECKILKIEEIELRPLDTLHEAMNVDDLDAVKSQVTTQVTELYQQREFADARDALAAQIRSNYDFKVPSDVVDSAVHKHLNRNHTEGESHNETSIEDETETREQVEKDIRFEAVINRVVDEAELTVTDTELQMKLFQLLQTSGQYGMQLLQYYQQADQRERLRNTLLEEKALDYLLEHTAGDRTDHDIPTSEEEAQADNGEQG